MFEGIQEHLGIDNDDIRSIYVMSNLYHFHSNYWKLTLSHQTIIL